MKKNWAAVAACGNEHLRLALIGANGAVASGLATGFPQYFVTDGESHPVMNRVQFVELVRGMDRREDVLAAIRDAGLPHQRLSFAGEKRGATAGVSYASGGYDTTARGRAQNFWRSASDVGETLPFEGADWVVVWNGFSRGDAWSFDHHTLVLIPAEALPEV